MPRSYTMSPAAKAARTANSAKARAVANSLDSYVQRVVDRAPELTDEHIAKLRRLLGPVQGGAAE